MKTYVVTPYWNRLFETVLMMGHNICFNGKQVLTMGRKICINRVIRKIIPLLFLSLLILSTDSLNWSVFMNAYFCKLLFKEISIKY